MVSGNQLSTLLRCEFYIIYIVLLYNGYIRQFSAPTFAGCTCDSIAIKTTGKPQSESARERERTQKLVTESGVWRMLVQYYYIYITWLHPFGVWRVNAHYYSEHEKDACVWVVNCRAHFRFSGVWFRLSTRIIIWLCVCCVKWKLQEERFVSLPCTRFPRGVDDGYLLNNMYVRLSNTILLMMVNNDPVTWMFRWVGSVKWPNCGHMCRALLFPKNGRLNCKSLAYICSQLEVILLQRLRVIFF